jgi:hypothetical protein
MLIIGDNYSFYEYSIAMTTPASVSPNILKALLMPGIVIEFMYLEIKEAITLIMPLIASGELTVHQLTLWHPNQHMALLSDVMTSSKSKIRSLNVLYRIDVSKMRRLLMHPSCRIQHVFGNLRGATRYDGYDIDSELKEKWVLDVKREVAIAMLLKGMAGLKGGMADLPGELLRKITQFI